MTRTRTVLMVIGLLMLAAILIAVWLGIRYTASPQYSLGNLAVAANSGDWTTVQAYADTDGISEAAADIVVDRQVSNLGINLGDLGDKVADAAKPAVAEAIEQGARGWVETRRGGTGLRERLGAQAYVRGAKRVLVDGDQALITIDIPFRGKRYEADLRMQRAGRRWRVVQVENLEELITAGGR